MTRVFAQNIFEPKLFHFGDKGDGLQMLGKTRTFADAEQVRRDLAWAYRLDTEEIEVLEVVDQVPEAHRGIC